MHGGRKGYIIMQMRGNIVFITKAVFMARYIDYLDVLKSSSNYLSETCTACRATCRVGQINIVIIQIVISMPDVSA